MPKHQQSNRPQAWRDNTPEDPFWRSKRPVRIQMANGTILRFDNPSDARALSPDVKRWKIVEK